MADKNDTPTLVNYKPKDAKDAKEHGLRMDGLPDHDHIPASRSGGGGGKEDLVTMVKRFVAMEMGNQDDLHAFCETGRAILHRMAVETHLAAGELTAGAKEMGRQNRQWGAVFKMRRVTKELERTAGGMADGAAGFVKVWTVFEKVFDDILGGVRPTKPKGFTINI